MKIQTGVIHLLWLMGALVVPAIVQQPIVATSPAPVKIIDYGGGGWKDGQVNEPCILVNPKDSSKLIMFYSGMKLGGSAGAIGKAWANVSEPFRWHEDAGNPIFTGDPGIPFEESAVRHAGDLFDPKSKVSLFSGGSFRLLHQTALGPLGHGMR
jgi:hypothetical protein